MQTYAQQKAYEDVNFKKYNVSITSSDSILVLPEKFLIKGSVTVYSDSTKLSAQSYTIDYRYGRIILKRFIIDEIIKDVNAERTSIIVAYKNLPFDIPDTYSRFEILNKIDTGKTDTVKVAEIRKDFIEDIFAGSDLQKSGSLFRGFTLGNNRDLTLQSGFRLQMSGKLSKDIDITAALTDENTPIQPEGNTQKLQEIDRVFIELRTSNITTTLGDIDVNFSGSEFFNFSKKLQGVKANGLFDKTGIFVSGALTRGRFASNRFNGIDGVQGPYRLIGADNEVNIIVIAGSEKVYLDGIAMVRGESNDYVIDYSTGEVKFTNRRLITNASRIVVDFEYSDKKYSRSFIAGETKTSLFKDRLQLKVSYLRERDDRDKPIDFILNDTDRTIISQAGDDKLKASKSGVFFAGRDSTGKSLGLYVEVDTLVNNQQVKIYRYAPLDTNALYQVTFSYVGAGKGDYSSLSSVVYQFAGIGAGSYLPIVFLPLPVSYQAGDVGLTFNVTKSLSLNVEGTFSEFDANLFSDSDDSNNRGGAIVSSILFNPVNLKLGSLELGNVQLLYRNRYVNKQYSSVDRLNKVEYERVWDIQDSTNQNEVSNEIGFVIKPKEYFSFSSTGGNLRRGDKFNSLRGNVDLKFSGDSIGVPGVYYNADFISSKDEDIDYRGVWIRQNGNLDYRFLPFKDKSGKPKFGTYRFNVLFSGEDKQIKSFRTDTINPASFRFYEVRPGISVTDIFSLDLSYNFAYRIDDQYNSGTLARLSNSYTHTYGIALRNTKFVTASADIVLFDRKYAETFRVLGFPDSRTILVSSQSNFWFFNRAINANLFYKVSSERTAKQEVLFLKVPIGQGNYSYLGDLNGNGLQDENEFVLVNYEGEYIKIVRPTDQLFPTTDLQSSANFNIAPSRVFSTMDEGIVKDIITNVTFDTYLSVAEKSKDPEQNNIYTLKFSTFQNDQNTITGFNNIQQDIGIFENNDYFGIKLRYIQRKGFNQYYSGNERQLNIERTARLRLSFTPDLALITDYVSGIQRNFSPNLFSRNWNINSEGVISELVYKPTNTIETGFKIELKRSRDHYTTPLVTADLNIETFRFVYSLGGKGTVRAEISRNEALLSTNPLFVPFDLTKGLIVGKSYFVTVNFEYRISNFIQATLNYFGRAEGKSRFIHTGTAEVRAYF